ncbi:hypothetical protein [Secundilactobacillus collinoides]|uniref:hypothetical protein n=1 Tax=Secundilactobacillus collinoides TaxID=33960 RepID=UPI0006D19F9A|nr:hypothetical protein [Secundilactobacillus collinoides]
MSQFQFNIIMLAVNAIVAFYFVRIFAKQIVSYEDYEGQFTMMTQYLSAIRTSLQSREGRSQTAIALMRMYIIPILVACLPSIVHITMVGTSDMTDILGMVAFILLFGSLAWLTSRLITSNRIWLPRKFFNSIVHNLWQEYQKLATSQNISSRRCQLNHSPRTSWKSSTMKPIGCQTVMSESICLHCCPCT